MADATADLQITRRAGVSRGIAVAAAVLLFAGTLVCVDADGRAVVGADAADLTFGGIAIRQVDNSDGAAAADTIEVLTGGEVLLGATGLASGDEGKTVYVIDSATVGLAASTDVDHYVPVGRITEVVSATSAWVRIEPGRKALQVVTIEVAGTNAAALDLDTVAGHLGGAGLYIVRVLAMQAYTTSTGDAATPCRRVITTHYTLADGVITTVGNQSTLTLVISAVALLT